MRAFPQIRLTPMTVAAALSVGVLIIVAATRDITPQPSDVSLAPLEQATTSAAGTQQGADWQQEMALLGVPVAPNPSATSTFDTVAMIGPMVSAELLGHYAGLQEQGTFSQSTAQAAAAEIAPNVRAVLTYHTYTAADLTTDTDTSYDRMLKYRADLRVSLAPLLKNTDAEFEIYARYVLTSDPLYLEQLSTAAQNYREAAEQTAAVEVPEDALVYHLAVLNSLEEFAAVLEALAEHGDDPLASVALLRSYNQAEQDVLDSFNNLTSYYSLKTP